MQNGVNTDTVFEILSEVETKKPLILLVYFNLIFAYGMKKFIKKCAEAGISGLIIPDLPFEENEEIFKLCEKEKIALIPLISITSEHRAKKVLSRAGGFIYAISAIGVTGTKLTPMERLKNMLSDLKKMSDLPVAVGFGIRTNEDIRNMRKYADGVILGTSIVKLVENNAGPKIHCISNCVTPCHRGEGSRRVGYCIADRLADAYNGIKETGLFFTGANGYRLKKLIPVKELIKKLVYGENS